MHETRSSGRGNHPSAGDAGNEVDNRLAEAVAQSWSRDTSAEPDDWSEGNPAKGQCAVTALIVQEVLGGELLRCEVGATSHYWNRLPSGAEIDLTRHQFGSGFRPGTVEERTRDYVLSFPRTGTRYDTLRKRVMAILRQD